MKRVTKKGNDCLYKVTVENIDDNQFNHAICDDKPNHKRYINVTKFNLRDKRIYLLPILDIYNGEVIL